MVRISPALILFLSALLLPHGEARAQEWEVSTSKVAFLRYELIDIHVTSDGLSETVGQGDTLVASVWYQDTLVHSVGGVTHIPCFPSEDAARWNGYWPIPWNPPLGSYTIKVETAPFDTAREVLASHSFEIIRRAFEPVEPGFCAMNIESTINFLGKPYPTMYDEAGSRNSFLDWARFLGADAVLYSVGQTMEGEDGVTDEHPWYPLNLQLFSRVAALTREAGFKCGGWIGCYFLWGENLKELDYTYPWDYWQPTERMYRPHRVSITDEKRLSDIAALATRLNADPNIDFVGLDYIRTGFGGYEMVDDFVRHMSVAMPDSVADLSPAHRRHWLAMAVEIEKDPDTLDRWRWYCAHRVSLNIRHIIEQSGLEKPLWVFLLGWRHGLEHGQDPVMFYDAGASWCSVMLYESDAEHCRQMNKSWSSYVDRGNVNLLVGESVDWDLLQKCTDPPGPEEYYRRVVEAVDGFYDGGAVDGAFWHDLHRGAWGKRGPYRRIEWAVTGASTFSYVRWKNGRIPLGVKIRGPRNVPPSLPFDLTIELINSGTEDAGDVVIRPIEIPHIRYTGADSILVGTVRAGTEASITLKCTLVEDPAEPRTDYMAALRTTWNGREPQDQFVSFAYIGGEGKKLLTE